MSESVSLRTNLAGGLIALFLGALLAALIAKSARKALFILGPYYVYCWINISVIWLLAEIERSGQLKSAPATGLESLEANLNDLMMMFIQIKFWPYVLEAFVGAAVAFAAAMAATHALAKSGKIQLADGEPKHVFTVEALCLPYPRRAGASRKSGTPQRIQQAPAAVPPGPAPPANAELHGFVQGRRRIAEAVVCPFCGDSRVKGKVPVPRQCRLCQRKISILVEREDGQRCAVCHGILVWGASFCHHCGSLQQEKA